MYVCPYVPMYVCPYVCMVIDIVPCIYLETTILCFWHFSLSLKSTILIASKEKQINYDIKDKAYADYNFSFASNNANICKKETILLFLRNINLGIFQISYEVHMHIYDAGFVKSVTCGDTCGVKKASLIQIKYYFKMQKIL